MVVLKKVLCKIDKNLILRIQGFMLMVTLKVCVLNSNIIMVVKPINWNFNIDKYNNRAIYWNFIQKNMRRFFINLRVCVYVDFFYKKISLTFSFGSVGLHGSKITNNAIILYWDKKKENFNIHFYYTYERFNNLDEMKGEKCNRKQKQFRCLLIFKTIKCFDHKVTE